ncbi:helix-turn-helix domain-containing protein [Luteibacter sp. 9133]|uniref:winged helix-turn-helix transcriptional regulator n=1 Tax=Luteibacter sp. 9133 TaxID=1500891 RepID=UPI00068E0063|nr:helix-turn-helix domain-containing protein [Luteibacter sp. 9133]
MPPRLPLPDDEVALIDVRETKPILDQIANKWSVMILSVVCENPVRFNQLLRRLEGITHKALTEALRRLERNGLVARRVLPLSPVAVEYSITPLGRTLKDPFDALCIWASRHGHAMAQAQSDYDERRLDHEAS